MRYLIIIILAVCCVTINTQAQKKTKKRKKSKQRVEQQDNAFAPFTSEMHRAQQKKVKSSQKKSNASVFNKKMDKKIDDYHKRMAKVHKERRKRVLDMKSDPQYANRSYFGHKSKPKIRPVCKRKFCKECKIVH